MKKKSSAIISKVMRSSIERRKGPIGWGILLLIRINIKNKVYLFPIVCYG